MIDIEEARRVELYRLHDAAIAVSAATQFYPGDHRAFRRQILAVMGACLDLLEGTPPVRWERR